MKFKDKFEKMSRKNDSLLCVGLDIDEDKIPLFLFKEKDPLFVFNREIIDATSDLVCCYKLNMAFYESLGIDGIRLLVRTVDYIPKEIPIILDGKRSDIGNTASKYAHALFEIYKGDATTVSPYFGIDGIKPFLKYKEKYIFVLCKTSNPSSVDIQDIPTGKDGIPLYQRIAHKIKDWNKKNNCGLVVGATYPDDLKIVREIVGDGIIILIPGVGKQGGDIETSVRNGMDNRNTSIIINSSRGVIYAGHDRNFGKVARAVAINVRDKINEYR